VTDSEIRVGGLMYEAFYAKGETGIRARIKRESDAVASSGARSSSTR